MAQSDYQHRLEKRANLLATALNKRVSTLSTSLKPPGARPPFTQMLSDRKALEWWLDNISNPETGGSLLQQMDPVSQVELHNALSQHIRTLMPGGNASGGF